MNTVHPHDDGQDELLDLEAAADILCVSKTTLYRMLDRGEVKGIKVGRQWRFRRADLEAYLSRGPVASVLAALPLSILNQELAALSGKLAEAGSAMPAMEEDDLDPWEARAMQLFLGIVALGLVRRASDIHFEIIDDDAEPCGLVRARIDGVLHELHRMPVRVHEALLLRVRMMATGETDTGIYLDAGLHLPFDGKAQDLRISMMSTYLGEMLTVRLFSLEEIRHCGIEALGFHPDDLGRVQSWLQAPSGVIIMSGPAGCGKTTLLYKMAQLTANPMRKVATVEDPVEYRLPPWVTQVEINAKTRNSASVLRALMHHDVDVIMVGVLRDLETIDLSLHGAETGHLMLAPVHVISAIDVTRRMVDVFPVEQQEQIRGMVAKSLVGIVEMRLVRVLCDRCKEPVEMSPDVIARIDAVAGQGGYAVPATARFHRAVGCPACGHTGYRGRTGVYEVLEPDPAYRSAILQDAGRDELFRLAVAAGMRSLAAEGIRKAAEGITSLEEVQPLVRQYAQLPAKEPAR